MMGHTNLSGPTDNLHRRMLHKKKALPEAQNLNASTTIPQTAWPGTPQVFKKKAIVTIAENAHTLHSPTNYAIHAAEIMPKCPFPSSKKRP